MTLRGPDKTHQSIQSVNLSESFNAMFLAETELNIRDVPHQPVLYPPLTYTLDIFY